MKGLIPLYEYINKARQATKHPAKLVVFTDMLKKIFNVELEEIIPGIEKELGSKILGIRGSADLLFTNVIFEIKRTLNEEIDDAKQKLKKYFQVLHERSPERKYIGIATDVIVFRAYTPMIKNGQIIDINEIGSIDISSVAETEAILWLDSFIFSKPKIRPTAEDLKYRFGPGTPTYAIAVNELQTSWDEVRDQDDAKLKFDLWSKSMEIVYGSKPKLEAFINHTYLVTLVKLIIYIKLSGDNIIKKNRIKKALSGEYFASYGILNLIEEDFFAWILHPKLNNKTAELFCNIARELLRYDLSQVDEDFFKGIYQEIVERGQRHRIGEYYTPEWLTELMLKEVIDLWKEKHHSYLPKLLDPACGSGTFLCNAIKMIREDLLKQKSPDQILDFILNSVVGVDVNPLATIIAKANYLIALGDLLRLGKPIIIPVYVADSIKIPRVLTTLATGGRITVYEIETDKRSIQIPKSVITQKAILSQVFNALRDATSAYRIRMNRDEAFKIFKKETLTKLTEEEFDVLVRTLNTILMLMDKRLDSIWIFILNNVYAPMALMGSKFDILIGNPPWIAMRDVENESYQDFLKNQILYYELMKKDQIQLFTHIETATLFFCRSSDLYLKEDGLIGFVMPRSVLTGAFQHANFKQFKRPKMKLKKILDLEDVFPLFNVPSCVLIAHKGYETQYPVFVRKYAGKLPEKNIRAAEAMKYLRAKDYMYEPPPTSIGYSWYYDKVKQGATIVPRGLWFVDFDTHPKLGIDKNRPLVKSAKYAIEGAKGSWKGVKLRDNIESDFIYATLLGGDLVSFGYNKLRTIVLPLELSTIGYKLLDVNVLRGKGFTLMARWLEKTQKLWEERRTKKAEKRFNRILERLDYNSLLTIQNPHKRYVVLYNTSGTNLVSCSIDRQTLPAFQVLETKISPKGFIAESVTYFYETDDYMEANYLCAILNSQVLNDGIKPLQPRGLFGERHIHRRPFNFPIPKFNKNNKLHTKLADLGRKCHAKVASLKFTKKSTAGLRKEARETIKKEIAEIDKLVSQCY